MKRDSLRYILILRIILQVDIWTKLYLMLCMELLDMETKKIILTCTIGAVLKLENVEDLMPTQWFFWWILRYFCLTRLPHLGHSSLASLDWVDCCRGQWCDARYLTTCT